MSARFLSAKLGGIVGFELPVERIVGKKKLSQNLGRLDRVAAADALAASADGESPAVAALMRETLLPSRD